MEQELFTITEVAKICGLSRNAAYMHFYRGHIEAEKTNAHKLYFTMKSIDTFRAKYVIYNN